MNHQLKAVCLFLLLSLSYKGLEAQITLESTYSHSGTYTQLAISGNKFYVMDVGANQCRVYNTNHSLWKTLNLQIPANNYLYDIKYVSEGLFTTDNSLCLAYVYYSYNETGQYYTFTAKVIKENGVTLLTVPGCQYLYVHTLADGSTKLVTYSYNNSVYPSTIETAVYNLPGNYVAQNEFNKEQMPAWPNPASDNINIPYQLPGASAEGELLLFDIQGKLLKSFALHQNSGKVSISVSSFPSGTYLYRIQAGEYQSATAKIILNERL